MAKKRQPTPAASKDDEPLTPASKKNEPPPPSKKPEEEKVEEKDDEDSTSEEASSSEGEEDSESEDEESKEEEQPPSSQPASKPAQTEKSESNNEDEEETDTDSDQEPPPKLKSINSKSIDQTLKSKPQLKSSAAPSSSGTKRSAENDTKQSKKKKTIAADDKKEQEEDNKKPGDDSKKLFQRVFTEDDELAILEGLVNFAAKTGSDPVKYPTAFFDDVKKLIHFPVTPEQLKDKVRRLKLKFENKLKSCKNGKTPTFSKSIEEKMFELGKKIWGGNVVEENGKLDEKPSKKGAVKKSPTTKKLEMEPDSSLVVFNETRKESVSNVFGSGMDLLKNGAGLLEESERIEFEKRWKQLQIDELKVFKMRAELAEEQGRFILDALMSSLSN